ncbi:MAG: hypothetical protein A3J46_02855 [Candidatus Yanofskybacteria bacterium RIFCSPHIGHO2_02_FULL_41_11]|uniref:Uncharacterized protein n=1 Tax=Candidatus Yanofskybacteria bacterium RIFCSPHIGHO2_02_FULL_41_11 TaxID=1802675 RepID=A0A1F8F632_9BACT|nr:MAG: hypothetical protein A3J46_02855 [Candidatus Yanofskybacteria bacterium RIFCSPHIGHO2_02_FULL_41_11]
MIQQKTFFFHGKNVENLDRFDNEVNKWLSENPNIDIVYVVQKATRYLAGTREEEIYYDVDIVQTVFYKEKELRLVDELPIG